MTTFLPFVFCFITINFWFPHLSHANEYLHNAFYISFQNDIRNIHRREKERGNSKLLVARQKIVGDLWMEHQNGNLTDKELESLLNHLNHS